MTSLLEELDFLGVAPTNTVGENGNITVVTAISTIFNHAPTGIGSF
jgi:hypothetical protein